MDRVVDYKPLLRRGGPASRHGEFRVARLREEEPTRATAYLLDLGISVAAPAGLGVVIAAVAVGLLQLDAVEAWVTDNPFSPQVLAALGTLVSLLVSMRLSSNQSKNAQLINEFGNLSGTCVNLAIWARSLVTSGEFEYLTLPDGRGKFYRTTELGLLLASVPYIVKYTERAGELRYEQLPLGGSPALLGRVRELTTPKDGLIAVSGFTAVTMMLGEAFDNLEARGLIKPPELNLFFSQLNALTAAEGAISGSVAYSPPRVLSLLLYATFVAYFAILTVTNIGKDLSWNSLWVVAVLVLTTVGIFALSERYENPFKIRSRNSTQRPLVSIAAKQTEMAIDGVMGFGGRFVPAPQATAQLPSGAWLERPTTGRRV